MKFVRLFLFLAMAAWSHELVAVRTQTDRVAEGIARDSYNFRTILDNRVEVSVEGGIATLTGTAQDHELRSLAADTLRSIANVIHVENRVILDTSFPDYSDAWIALRVRHNLLVRAHLDATRIEVTVSDRVLTLKGAVGSEAQKQLAVKYAGDLVWVRSIKNDLVVDSASNQAAVGIEAMDDASISTQLKYILSRDQTIATLRTEITTSGGVVAIAGHAHSGEEKELISRIALTVRGVKSVRNNLIAKN